MSVQGGGNDHGGEGRREELARLDARTGDTAARASAAMAELHRARAALWHCEGWAARARLRAAHAQAVRWARELDGLRAKLALAEAPDGASGRVGLDHDRVDAHATAAHRARTRQGTEQDDDVQGATCGPE